MPSKNGPSSISNEFHWTRKLGKKIGKVSSSSIEAKYQFLLQIGLKINPYSTENSKIESAWVLQDKQKYWHNCDSGGLILIFLWGILLQ